MLWSISDTLAIIKANQPLFAPDTDIAYGDSNYAILGEIIEMVSGKPVRTVVADSIPAKLGLTHTLWPADSMIPARTRTDMCRKVSPTKPRQAFDNAAHPPKVVTSSIRPCRVALER